MSELINIIYNWLRNNQNTLLVGVFVAFIYWMISKFCSKVFFFLGDSLGQKEVDRLIGLYDCMYIIPWKPEGSNIIYERILIIRGFSKHTYKGYLLQAPADTENKKYRTVQNGPVLRLEGKLIERNFFIGRWRHPGATDGNCGAFHMLVDLEGQVHEGIWCGLSHTYGKVLGGHWRWNRIGSKQYNWISLMRRRFSSKCRFWVKNTNNAQDINNDNISNRN